MPSRIVPRVARAKPTEEETRLEALASVAARRARIAAATVKLEVPASKKHMQFAARPAFRKARSSNPLPSSEEAWTDTSLFRKESHLKRPTTPRFAREAALPIAACRDAPNPRRRKPALASEETLALHRSYGRSESAKDPSQWNQSKIPCNVISGERLSRKSRPQRRLRFREGDVTRVRIVSRWISEVPEEAHESEQDSDSDEDSELEDEEEMEQEGASLSGKMSLPLKILDDWDDDDSYDWAKAIKDSLEKKIF